MIAITAALVISTAFSAAAQKTAKAELHDGMGNSVGTAEFSPAPKGVSIRLNLMSLPPGVHGIHVHAVAKCEGPAFTTAGGHFAAPGQTHGGHAGDLPSLLVNADGTASAAFETDRFTLDQLRDADGSALIIHAGADNFANIPARYGTPDQETLNTGDAGARAACGVIR